MWNACTSRFHKCLRRGLCYTPEKQGFRLSNPGPLNTGRPAATHPAPELKCPLKSKPKRTALQQVWDDHERPPRQTQTKRLRHFPTADNKKVTRPAMMLKQIKCCLLLPKLHSTFLPCSRPSSIFPECMTTRMLMENSILTTVVVMCSFCQHVPFALHSLILFMQSTF